MPKHAAAARHIKETHMPDFKEEAIATPAADTPFISVKIVELAVAAFTAAIGAVVMTASREQGIGWNDTGPQAGYFPFYIGLIMLSASAATIVMTILKWRKLTASFVAREPFRHVLAVFAPICVYGIAIRFLGMYLASALFIAWFMWRERGEQRHGLLKIAIVSTGVAIACYLIFERWFQVPLYAGALAEWLNIGE
jgi:hypothetical protein